jgi:hypothetical protein
MDRVRKQQELQGIENERRQRQNQSAVPGRNNVRINDRAADGQSRVRIDRTQQQALQRQRWNQYNQRWGNWQSIESRRQAQLRQQRRNAYLAAQQRYWNRIRQDQLRLQQARFYDNYYNNYRYNRGGQWYYTSQYGAQMLQNAINNGYEEGFYEGQADRRDGWQFNYQNAYGYQDATYGYDSYYVGMDEYSYYFREGFRRGYEDGYYGRNQYGSYSSGKYNILGSILGTILDFAIN